MALALAMALAMEMAKMTSEETYSRWYLDYHEFYLFPAGTKEWVRKCRVCRGNKDYICAECAECGEIDVQSYMDNLHNNSINNGDYHILSNEPPRGNDGICKTT